MHAFDVLGDPVRRRILELLADGEQPAGAISDVCRAEFGISPPAVSQHLRVLRESGFATVRAEGTRRLYAVDAEPLMAAHHWLERFRPFWNQRLDALATELARGRRERRPEPKKASPDGSPLAETEAASETATATTTEANAGTSTSVGTSVGTSTATGTSTGTSTGTGTGTGTESDTHTQSDTDSKEDR